MARLPDQALELLNDQFGIVGRFQLLDFMSRGQIDGLVQRGELIPHERGQYRVRGAPQVPEQHAMAAQLRGRPDACITGPFVLAILNIEGFTRSDPFEALLRPDRRIGNVEFSYRANPTPDATTGRFKGLRVATITNALVDSGRFADELGERRVRVGFDNARARRLTSSERLQSRVRELGPDDPGAMWWDSFLTEGSAENESEGERRVAPLLDRFDPSPEPQVWVTPTRRVDWFWRPIRLALEYFGLVDHRGERERLRDGARNDELKRLEIEVVPIIAEDLADENAFLLWIESVARSRAFELGVEAPRLLLR
ncbi:MAG: hypothetical protein KY469_07180 [Actinobacteria bacterium]|nr:hypothetical protein [Actinomycetota bacterium]